MRIRSLSLIGLLLLVAASANSAGPSSQAPLLVSARIPPRASVQWRTAPATVQVSRDDVLRGYVQLPAPLQLAVQTNLAGGLLLEFASALPFVLRTEVEMVDGVRTGGLSTLVAYGSGTLTVRVRLYLDPQTAPGIYDWPVRVRSSA